MNVTGDGQLFYISKAAEQRTWPQLGAMSKMICKFLRLYHSANRRTVVSTKTGSQGQERLEEYLRYSLLNMSP